MVITAAQADLAVLADHAVHLDRRTGLGRRAGAAVLLPGRRWPPAGPGPQWTDASGRT